MKFYRYCPAIFSILLYAEYAITHEYLYRFTITVILLVSAVAVIAIMARNGICKGNWKVHCLIPGAFTMSIIGDYLLHISHKSTALFICGMLFFFLAHVCYILFFLRHGKLKWTLMAGLTAALGIYFILVLVPRISFLPLLVAVAIYALISCISVSAAAGMYTSDPEVTSGKAVPMAVSKTVPRAVKILMVTGICSLLFSDFLISLHNFAHIHTLYFTMLPTYYLSQVLILIGLTFTEPTLSHKNLAKN